MIPEELKARIETYLRCKWTGSLAYGPVPYNPPSKEQAENLGITYEEAVEFYDYLLTQVSQLFFSIDYQ